MSTENDNVNGLQRQVEQVIQAVTGANSNSQDRDLILRVIQEVVTRRSEQEQLAKQVRSLQDKLAEARTTIAKLTADNTELRQQRADYSRALTALLPPVEPISEQEFEDLKANGVTLEEAIKDIERSHGRYS